MVGRRCDGGGREEEVVAMIMKGFDGGGGRWKRREVDDRWLVGMGGPGSLRWPVAFKKVPRLQLSTPKRPLEIRFVPLRSGRKPSRQRRKEGVRPNVRKQLVLRPISSLSSSSV